jgi:hypothetical protein
VNYPLALRIQVFSLSAKIEVLDARQNLVCSARKKRFKFREHVTVFSGPPARLPLCEIRAVPSPGFPVRYTFTTPQGQCLGIFARTGTADKIHYAVQTGQGATEWSFLPKAPRARTLDRVLSRIPLLRLLSACLFRPAFAIRSQDGQPVSLLRKRAALLENRYLLDPPLAPEALAPQQELRFLIAALLVVLLES